MILARLAIQRPVTTLMFYCGVILLGFVSFRHLSVDLLPDINYPRLSVITFYPGAAPEEVESLITTPLEAAVSGIPGVRRVESVSREGVSFLSLEFNWGTNMDFALLHTREKLDAARVSLPQEAENPTIVTVDPQSQPIMIIALLADASLLESKELAEELVKPRLEQIEGIGSAEVTGGVEREIKVEINPSLLPLYGLTIEEVARRIDAFNRNLQGGIIRQGQFKHALRVVGEFQSIEEIAAIPLKTTAERGVIRVRDVAKVTDSIKERQGVVRLDGRECVSLLLRKEAGANTVRVTKLVHQVLREIEREHPALKLVVVSEEARVIEESIRSVEKEIVLGGLLAFLIFFLFLQELFTSLTIFAVIAVSVIATFNLLFLRSITLNIMSLGGLALGVGMLDDCAIVVTENIFRHRSLGKSWKEASATGTGEVGLALSASIFTTIAVFLPVIYIHGVAGQLFRDQALTVTFSLLVSLLVSLTFIPMISSRPWSSEGKEARRSKGLSTELGTLRKVLPPFPCGKQPLNIFRWPSWLLQVVFRSVLFIFHRAKLVLFPPLFRFLALISRPGKEILGLFFQNFNRIYERSTVAYRLSLLWSLEHKRRILAFSLLAFALILLLGSRLPRELVPQLKVPAAECRLRTPVDYSFEQTVSLVQTLEENMIRDPAITRVFSQTGMVSGLEAFSPEISLNSSRLYFQTRTVVELERIIQSLRSWASLFPETNLSILREQSTLAQWLGPGTAELGLRLYGDDLRSLKEAAQTLASRLKNIPGVSRVNLQLEEGKPEFLLRIRKEAVEENNLSPEAVSSFLVQMVRGRLATSFKEINKKYDIIVKAAEVGEQDIESLLSLTFPASSKLIPLRHLVSYEIVRGPGEIRRENQQRMVQLTLNLKGRRPAQVLLDIQKMAEQVATGAGIRLGFGKEAEEMRLSYRSLLLAFALSVILVYMIMAAQFESLLHPFLIMFTVPMGLAGSILALALTRQTINIISLIGIVVSVGIVVNNAIVEIDIINQLRRQGTPLRQAVVEGCSLRLRPILMSSLSTVFGLIPLSLGLGGGGDLERPLGIAISGGLLLSTFLTLILIPCLYEAMEKRRARELS